MTRPIEALILSPPAPVWGAQIFLLGQIEGLRDRGVQLTLGTTPDSPFALEWQRRGLPLIDVGLKDLAGLRVEGTDRRPSPWAVAGMALDAARNARRIAKAAGPFDMLYSYSLGTHLETALAGRLARTPSALDLVDLVRPGIGRRVLRSASRLASLTVANSAATARLVEGAGRVRIIQPGIDLARFHPAPSPPGLRDELQGGIERPLVGVVGRLDEGKGIHILVDAMAQLSGAAADARLVVVGVTGTDPPSYAERLRQRSAELLGDRVLFVGRRDDIADIMNTIDVLVVASASEPFGLTALEAQACRTPVVGTDAGGLPEFVVHEETGLLVPPLEAEPMARAIERMLTDDALREAMVDEAERRANPDRGLDAQYDLLAQMYRDVVARRTG